MSMNKAKTNFPAIDCYFEVDPSIQAKLKKGKKTILLIAIRDIGGKTVESKPFSNMRGNRKSQSKALISSGAVKSTAPKKKPQKVIQSKPAKPVSRPSPIPHWSNAGKPAMPHGMAWAKRKGKVVLVPIKPHASSAKQKKLKPMSTYPANARKDIAKIRKQLFSTSNKSNVNTEIQLSNLSEEQKFAIAGRFDNTAAFGDQKYANKAMDFYLSRIDVDSVGFEDTKI